MAVYGVLGCGKSNISFINQVDQRDTIYCYDENISTYNSIKEHKDIIIEHFDNWDWKNLDYVLVSPGVNIRYDDRYKNLKRNIKNFNIPTICDIEMFLKGVSHKSFKIGVTGTNGKSTTVSLLNHIISSCNVNSIACGNNGLPVFNITNNYDTYILELSSYQLSLMSSPHLDCGVILNVSLDHMNYYRDFEDYKNDKLSICNLLKDKSRPLVIGINSKDSLDLYNNINIQDFSNICIISLEPLSNISAIKNCIYYDNGYIHIKYNSLNTAIELSIDKLHIKGSHNIENIMASIAVCLSYNLELNSIIKAIYTFAPLRHRQQKVAEHKNITFINDSKATNISSTLSLLNSYDNLYLLLGGVYKGDTIEDILKYQKNIKHISLYGESVKVMEKALGNKGINIESHNTMFEALDYSFKIANNDKDNVNIALSPACASFDQFKGFEDRGDKFIEAVNKIITQ